MLRLSLLSINQLDTLMYTLTFGCGKCSRSSQPSTVTANHVNDLYFISPATALTSSVPSMSLKSSARKRQMKRNGASSSAHTSAPSIPHSNDPTKSPLYTACPRTASPVPQCPSATKFWKPSQKLLTISELQLCHHCLAQINLTALQSLIDGHTKDDSICTACIQAKHK